MATGPASLPVVNEPTVRRGLILTAGGIDVEVFEDQLNALSEAPKAELDETMMNAGVVLFSRELLSVEQLAKLSIVTSTRAHEEMARPTPVAFANNHLDGLLGKQVSLVLLRTTWMKKQLRAEYATTQRAVTEHEQEVLSLIDLRLDMITSFDHLYSYEEEEEIKEDTSRQAQHGVSGLGGNADEQEGSSSESSSGSSSSDESIEHDGEGLGLHPGWTERTEKHRVALEERVDEQQATGDNWDVEEQEGGAAGQDFGTRVQQQEGRAAAQEGGVGGEEQEGGEAAQEGLIIVRRRHRTASGSGQAGPSTAGRSTSAIASGDQVVELLQRVAEVEASQKKLVADLLEGARSKLDEMSEKIIEGVAAAIRKASEGAVEKQLKLVEERLVALVVKGIENVIKEDLFYSTLPPESMKELKDVVRESYQEDEAGRLEVLTEAMARGFRGSAGLSTRSRQEEEVAGVRSGVERRVHERSVPPSSLVGGHVGSPVASPPSRARQTVGKSVEDKDVIVLDQSPRQQTSEAAPKPLPDAFAPLRDMLQGLGKKGGKGVVAGEKSGAVGKGAGEKRGAPSQVAVAAGLLSKTKADSAEQLGIAGRPVEPVGKRPSSVLGDVSLSKPGSPPPGPRPRSPSASKKRQAVTKLTKRAVEATESSDIEMASTVVAARHEKSKKPKVIGYAPPPPPDDQGKTRGCKAPFKGPGMMPRKGKPVSEQTVGSRKRFLGTFETEADQKFCTAICGRVYFPDIDLKEYEGFTAQDEKDWKVYLDAAARMPTGVWSVAQEQGECRFDDCSFRSLLATTNTEVRAGTDWGIALCVAIRKVATLGRRHGNVIYPVPKNMHGTAHMMAVAATVASLWAACRKLWREDIKKDALAAANAALYAPEMATRASAAAMAALLSVLLPVGKTFPAKQWPDLLYSSAVEGLGWTDATLLQMVRVAALLCDAIICIHVSYCDYNKKAISSKLIFRHKYGPDGELTRYKSRLVAKGFQQTKGKDFDEILAPVGKGTTLRVMLGMAANRGWKIKQMDITTAFLNGIILEELYMLQPEGLDDGSGRVCRLKKAIYGLKQAPRAWYHKLEETLLAGGFKKSECDHSLFLLQEKEQFLMLLVYVDDILLFSESAAMIERVEEMLEMQFKCSKMGDVKYYLGMHVERDLDKGVLRLHQRKYCEGLAEKYGLQDGGKPATPLPSGFTVEPCADEEVVGESDRKLFHSMVGALNYAANHTRPDIAFVTSRLASVVSRPSHEQLEAAKRLVRYVSATASVGLEYSVVRQRLQRGAADLSKGEMLLTCYTDASFNSVKADGTSIGGYVCLFGGGAVSSRSKKQNEVGLSSCETEYMALHHGVKEVVWLRRLLEEIGVCQKEPTVILCDNESAVKLAKNACLHGLTKHIRPKWHWVRRLLDTEVQLEIVKTHQQAADILTKRLAENEHWKGMKLAGMSVH
ncbi:unnamed protein product [Closterium sp. NIES-54]